MGKHECDVKAFFLCHRSKKGKRKKEKRSRETSKRYASVLTEPFRDPKGGTQARDFT